MTHMPGRWAASPRAQAAYTLRRRPLTLAQATEKSSRRLAVVNPPRAKLDRARLFDYPLRSSRMIVRYSQREM